ncbi:Amino acid transporter [Pseudomonas syringae pv. actinidiae]|uniref:Amino acid transporter n=1 Tax=Pseudomonas syringae pv. actinidiae TaxID=103796 RepID=A0A2V0QPK6_PSESF|nr:Amino acid transporter [Pseudomonas syringae pv. actinidiae]GBH16847.1 Amino acid transporter [Pseudomonas syringae pv. actinidiae]
MLRDFTTHMTICIALSDFLILGFQVLGNPASRFSILYLHRRNEKAVIGYLPIIIIAKIWRRICDQYRTL